MSTRLNGHGRLTHKEVQHATKRGLYPDGLGLCLQIARNGSKSWIMRYRIGGKRRYLGLGVVRDVPLAQARERAAAARLMLDAGQDPIEVKKGRRVATLLAAAKSMSFSKAAATYIESHRAGWSEKSTLQWITSIDTYANPILGELPVSEVDTTIVMKVLQPIWNTKAETASRLRGRIEAVLNWAKARGFREGDQNPAAWRGHLEALLPAKSKIAPITHLKALAYTEIGTFMTRLRAISTVDARALEFAILTAARSGETLGARWDEIDLANATWTVPAARMKSKREHRVALSTAAVELLRALPAPHDGPVFPGVKPGRSINRTRLLGVLRQINPDITVHGFRSAFRDWAGDRTMFTRELAEAALAHVTGDRTEAAYRRGDALEKRRQLMEAWATYCSAPATAEVIELRRLA
jgi:integrase